MCWISDGASQTRSERDGGEPSGRSSARLDALGGEVVEDLVDHISVEYDADDLHL
jgi:hypothetical protein